MDFGAGAASQAGDLFLSLEGLGGQDRGCNVAQTLERLSGIATLPAGCRGDGTSDSLLTIEDDRAAELSTLPLRWRPEGRCAAPWITSGTVSGGYCSFPFTVKGYLIWHKVARRRLITSKMIAVKRLRRILRTWMAILSFLPLCYLAGHFLMSEQDRSVRPAFAIDPTGWDDLKSPYFLSHGYLSTIEIHVVLGTVRVLLNVPLGWAFGAALAPLPWVPRTHRAFNNGCPPDRPTLAAFRLSRSAGRTGRRRVCWAIGWQSRSLRA